MPSSFKSFHGVVHFDHAQSVRAECGSGGLEQQYGLWNEPSGISCATIGLTAATAMMMVRETSSCVIPSSLSEPLL